MSEVKMYKVKRNPGCFTISNSKISVDLKPIPADRTICGGIFIVFGVFSLLENSRLIGNDSKIILFEAVDAFNDYLRSMEELNTFTDITCINTGDTSLKLKFLDMIGSYQVRDIRIMMNSRIFRMEEDSYCGLLGEINNIFRGGVKDERRVHS
jgi:hypothetical protein